MIKLCLVWDSYRLTESRVADVELPAVPRIGDEFDYKCTDRDDELIYIRGKVIGVNWTEQVIIVTVKEEKSEVTS